MERTDEKKRVEIFCCYAREDQSLLIELKKHLKLWERQGLITLRTDIDITAGTNWEKEIVRHLNAAHIILILVSPDFLASEYCYSTEMMSAMERYDRGEVRVIPIILRHCSWQEAPFGKFQALPAHAEPVVSPMWHDQDEAFTNVVRGIRQVVEALTQSSQQKGVKDFLTKPPLTYEVHPDQTQQTYSTSSIPGRPDEPAHQGISRRMVLLGLAGLATVAVAGSSIALLTHMQPSQKPPVASPTPASTSSGAMFGYDLQRTHFNPDEHTLSPTTVSRLVPYWTATTGNPIRYSSPVVAGDRVYVGSEDHTLYAFHAATGSILWTASTGYWVRSSPAVAGDVVYVGSEDHMLYAFHASTGSILWTASTGGPLGDSSPAVAGSVVYVGSNDGKLYAFHATTGSILWTATTGGPIRSSPTVANGVIYIGSDDHMLYAFDIATGSVLWTASTSDQIRSSPAVANGVVYVGSWDHKLYAFHLPA